MKLHSLRNKVVIITGASSGIGRACALEFSSHGSNLVLAARNQEMLESVVNECRNKGVHVLGVRTDVSQIEDCRNLIDAAIAEFGRIDILVNNAGMSMRALFQDVSIDVLHRLMDVNFWGTVYCTKFALPELLKNKGSIVGISSVAGFKGLPGRAGYSASKFAMNGLLEVIRVENRKKDLHVLICAPGFTASNIRNTALNKEGKPQTESPLDESRLMPPQKVAEELVKAIIKRKPYLVLTVVGKMTVWLNKFFPIFMDKMAYNHLAKEPDSPFK